MRFLTFATGLHGSGNLGEKVAYREPADAFQLDPERARGAYGEPLY